MTLDARLRWRRPLTILLLFLFVFFLGRVALLVLHGSEFEELGTVRLVRSFARGVRFDLSMTLLVAGLPLWLMMLPARWAAHRAWQATWTWIAYVALIVSMFVVIGDLVYFGTVGRHVGSELALTLGSDREALVSMALHEPLPLGLFALFSAALAVAWRRLPASKERDGYPSVGRNSRLGWLAWLGWACVLLLAVIGIRGGLQHKPINIVNGYEYGSVAEGNLTLNAPFTAYHSARNTRPDRSLRAFEIEEAIDIVRSRFVLEDEAWSSDLYPLERSRTDPAERRGQNVVVLVLESWDALLVDAIRRREGLPELGLTPVFDSLANEGLLFTNFYSSGQRSIEGIAALIASVPTLPGMPYLGRGMGQSRLSYLGQIARDNGYGRVFVRSAKRGSYRLDAVAALAGFEDYAAAEDILDFPSHTESEPGPWGAWDFDSLRYLDRLLRERRDPFVGFYFGSSTHQPFSIPGPQWEVRPTESTRDRFLNAVHYVDWALGQYFDLAREAGYLDNTLFLITADQTSQFVDASTPVERHRVPALLVGPGIARGTVNEAATSQMDVLPTIIDYLGWDNVHASFGESMLSGRRSGALLKQGDLMLRVGPEGWIVHDLERRLDGAGSEAVQAELERLLLAEVQVIMNLLSTNRLFSGG